jgi:hypothetical protein
LRQLVSDLDDEQSPVFRPSDQTTLLMLEVMEKLGPLFQDAEVLDAGTGSGILILAALKHLGARHGTATDINDLELTVTRRHADRFGIPADRLETLKGNLFNPVRGGQFDVVLFSPPPSHWLLRTYLRELGGNLSPKGVGFLMWNADFEADVVSLAHGQGIWLAPILEGPSGWTVYAVTRSLGRLQEISSMLPDAGMEDVEAAAKRVVDALKDLFSHPAGVTLHWQVLGPSILRSYPFLASLEHSSRFVIDSGGEGTDAVARVLSGQPNVRRDGSVHYYGEADDVENFSRYAAQHRISFQPNPHLGPDPRPKDLLRQILSNLTNLTGYAVEQRLRDNTWKGGLTVEQLVRDLETLRGA